MGVRCRRCSERAYARIKSDRKSTRLNSSHLVISYAVFCLKKKINFRTYSVYLPKHMSVLICLHQELLSCCGPFPPFTIIFSLCFLVIVVIKHICRHSTLML